MGPTAAACRRVARGLLLAPLAFVLPHAPPCRPPAGDPLVAKSQLQKLEAIAREVAAKGHDAEMNELLDVANVLGEESAALAKARADCDKAIAGVKVPASGPAVAGIARGLHLLAGDLAKLLATLDERKRGTLAGQILRLDDDQPAAHKALGHVNENGQWTCDEWKKIAARRRAIAAAILAARRLEIPLSTLPTQFGPLAAFDPAPATAVRYGKIEVISTMEAPRLERIVRGALRAAALSNFLRFGVLEVPTTMKDYRNTVVLVVERARYLRSIDLALAAMAIRPEDEARHRVLDGYADGRHFYVAQHAGEVDSCADLTFELSDGWLDENMQTCLVSGHINWLCLTCFGTTMPHVVADPKSGGRGDGRTADRPRDTPEENLARSLATAGLSGARRWLLFKAMHGEDPAWSRSFVDEMAKLVDLDLLKSTFVVEFLQQSERFDLLLRRTAMKEKEQRSRAAVIEAQIEEGLPAFEERFHAWLLPRGAAVAQRLELAAQPAEKLAREEAAALAELERVRRSAWDAKAFGPAGVVGFDRELANGCARHVAYLKLHPAQLEKWPDAHEEYPDLEGFSAEGCWAGTHSVIAPAANSAEEAIAAWMGTFYHRLPLLDPGLKRIGFSMSGRLALLDAGSLVEPDAAKGAVLWPPNEMKEVPTRFAPEIPNPVPGQDEKQFGYPVTLQTFGLELTYTLKLVKGTKGEGPEVACHFSSPGQPTNPDCNPAGAWCLIPKGPLESRTRYTVVAEANDGSRFTWSFTTEG